MSIQVADTAQDSIKLKDEQCIYSIWETKSGIVLNGIEIIDPSLELVFLPKTLPKGYVVNKISPRMRYIGRTINKFVVSDSYTDIPIQAFRNIKAREFVWPADCKKIPISCFESNKHIEKVSGIRDVQIIERSAFCNSGLKYIDWSEQCSSVPELCFFGSKLESIGGLERVNCVEPYAFTNAKNLKKLDMSGAPFCIYQPGSLCGLDGIIIFPYFSRSEDFKEAFDDKFNLF